MHKRKSLIDDIGFSIFGAIIFSFFGKLLFIVPIKRIIRWPLAIKRISATTLRLDLQVLLSGKGHLKLLSLVVKRIIVGHSHGGLNHRNKEILLTPGEILRCKWVLECLIGFWVGVHFVQLSGWVFNLCFISICKLK